MLQIKPNCEHCNMPLAANSNEAMICSYECTFCQSCVDHVLKNVCPNCGGNFYPRPIRPENDWCGNTGLKSHPASTKIVYKPVDLNKHQTLIQQLEAISPDKR